MSAPTAPDDDCGCGSTEPTAAPRNTPGLPALSYRVDVHDGFLNRMLRALPQSLPDGSRSPLASLTARDTGDPSIALLDASAWVADTLTFYQERIANEGYLSTATERRSALELARTIGYELAPGVAASTYLAFAVEDAPGAAGEVDIPAGLAVQSVPSQDKLPQVFETSGDFHARSAWNALRPRLKRPAELALVVEAAGPLSLALIGPVGSFPPTVKDVHPGLTGDQVFRLDGADTGPVDALGVTRVYVRDAGTLVKGDLVVFVGRNATGLKSLPLRAAAVTPQPQMARVAIDLEPLGATHAIPPALTFIPILKTVKTFATVSISAPLLNNATIATVVGGKAWRESDLTVMIDTLGWSASAIEQAAKARPPPAPVAANVGAFAFREKLGFFGSNAPKWSSLPKGSPPLAGNPYPRPWDGGDSGLPLSRTIWTDSQGDSLSDKAGADTLLERSITGLNRGSWVLFESLELPPALYASYDAREVSRADYGLSGKATALSLADTDGNGISGAQPDFRFRTTTAHVVSRLLDFADLPIDTPVEALSTEIELDTLVLGLAPNQPIALTGERADLAGVAASEIALIANVFHADGHTTLQIHDGLANSYVRSSLIINANCVAATHGETVNELLGGGDGTAANQRYTLKKPPLTYVSAPTPAGVESTLTVRVNDVAWQEEASLYGVPPDRQAFIVRRSEAGTSVIFGDGRNGARLPTGAANISATYRSGIGPDGEVQAGSLTLLRALPLGLRSVTNPLAAAGAEAPEELADARQNAPLVVTTFDRIVSLTDCEDFARTFPGIGKARCDVLVASGTSTAFITIAGATGGPPGGDVLDNLSAAIRGASDGGLRFAVGAFVRRYFAVKAGLVIDPRYLADDVLASVRTKLVADFSFDVRDFGQSVAAAEVIRSIHMVDGVVAVDLDALTAYGDVGPQTGSGPTAAVLAGPARFDSVARAFKPAELLLISPVDITLSDITP